MSFSLQFIENYDFGSRFEQIPAPFLLLDFGSPSSFSLE